MFSFQTQYGTKRLKIPPVHSGSKTDTRTALMLPAKKMKTTAKKKMNRAFQRIMRLKKQTKEKTSMN